MTAQLHLFEEPSSNGVATKAEVGLAKEIGPGAERLLAALVLRGLPRELLRPAAAIVLALDDEGANGEL